MGDEESDLHGGVQLMSRRAPGFADDGVPASDSLSVPWGPLSAMPPYASDACTLRLSDIPESLRLVFRIAPCHLPIRSLVCAGQALSQQAVRRALLSVS